MEKPKKLFVDLDDEGNVLTFSQNSAICEIEYIRADLVENQRTRSNANGGSEMNRKVEVFKYEWVDPKTCKARHMVSDGIATFHQFGQDYEEFESGGCMFPIAIIERSNGKVETVRAEFIKFINT